MSSRGHPAAACPPPQARLLQAPWPEELLGLAPAAALALGEGAPVYRGLRAAMGMTGGPLVEVRPCGRSGRAEFFGPLLNQAARIAGMANGGQVRCAARPAARRGPRGAVGREQDNAPGGYM